MSTSRLFTLGLFALALAAVACGGSSGGTSGKDTANSLVLVDVSVGGFDGVPLNEIIVFEFSEALDPDTVRADTIQIREGPNYGWQVPGHFRIDGNMVYFYPRLPVLPDLSDSGLQAGKPYRITLPGNPKVATVRSYANEHLLKKTVVTFQTALTGSANLFVDNFLDPLPPKVLFVNPPDLAMDVPAASEITLTMNRRPLHPASVTASNIKLTMVERSGNPVNRPISGGPELTQSYDSVTIVYRPSFPLADDAKYELTVDRRVQDLVGNDLVPFGSEFTIRDEPFRHTDLTLTFNQAEYDSYADLGATTASWNEVVTDALAALFTAAGGNGLAGDLTPKVNKNYTPDDFKRGVDVETFDGQDYHVYNFRDINIPAGVTVRFSPPSGGPNLPIKLICLKPITINGTLTVSGGRGKDAETASANSANPQAKGGDSGPGGSEGANSYGGTKYGKSSVPQHGDDVLYGGEGGKGGTTTSYYYSFGGGGGGGGARTAGKDGGKGGYASSSYYNGKGGKGGKSSVQRGYPLNYEREPNVGGAGGGAGGDGLYNWGGAKIQGAASAGGGGGALGLQSAGAVTIGSTGKILADGGDGGDIKLQYWYGGAGGGAAGGSIKIRATKEVTFGAGATLSVKGGAGGKFTATYTYYKGSEGGAGGDGWLRIEAMEDENSPGKPVINGINNTALTYGPPSTGVFAPKGGGAPSIGQTLWINLGVFDPVMVKPGAEDVVATLFNDVMTVEVQMATEDPNALGHPNLNGLDLTDLDGDGEFGDTLDPTTLSEWTPMSQIEILNGNGYQFIRVRITFQLDDNQTVDLPLPYLDLIRFPFKF